MNQIILETKNLVLRPFSLADADEVVRLAGDKDISKTTLNIPHPYHKNDAQNWISSHKEKLKKGELLSYAITKKDDQLVGCVSLVINNQHSHGELGYWMGKDFWNLGFCTEASSKILEYGFEELKLNKIYAYHLGINPASGTVMKKIGMRQEGLFEKHVKKGIQFHDLYCFGILRGQAS